jgi:hypothetical protein
MLVFEEGTIRHQPRADWFDFAIARGWLTFELQPHMGRLVLGGPVESHMFSLDTEEPIDTYVTRYVYIEIRT